MFLLHSLFLCVVPTGGIRGVTDGPSPLHIISFSAEVHTDPCLSVVLTQNTACWGGTTKREVNKEN